MQQGQAPVGLVGIDDDLLGKSHHQTEEAGGAYSSGCGPALQRGGGLCKGHAAVLLLSLRWAPRPHENSVLTQMSNYTPRALTSVRWRTDEGIWTAYGRNAIRAEPSGMPYVREQAAADLSISLTEILKLRRWHFACRSTMKSIRPQDKKGLVPPEIEALAVARERVMALRASLEACEGRPVRLVETHISWVLLTDSLAYKLKKPVKLPFLDFTTLAARRRFCEEELRLNRRLAPSLYIDVVDVCDGPQGPQFGGAGRVLGVAVRMRRFPDGALWSEMLAEGTLAARHIDAMAQRLADFHRDAAVAMPGDAFGSAPSHERVTQGLIDAIEAINARRTETATPGPDIDWPALRAWLGRQRQALAPLWAARLRDGRVRECHGDLHLANVLQLAGEATAFDGIEFDDELRWIDVLDDIAFLAMDLLAHGQRALAFRFINAYLEASGDYDGLPALRFFMVCRALVRAQVMTIRDQQCVHSAAGCGTADYLALASALYASADARLAITHGLPGSGKSFVSQWVIDAVGAIRVRSDVERKRLFGLGALRSSRELVPGGIYDEATTARTYARLHEVAQVALGAGWPVVVDAAFLRRAERAQFAALAASLSVPFSIFDCQAALPLLRKRLEQRSQQQEAGGADPSEADVAVLERLTEADEPLEERERAVAIVVDAAQAEPPATLAKRWLAAALTRVTPMAG